MLTKKKEFLRYFSYPFIFICCLFSWLSNDVNAQSIADAKISLSGCILLGYCVNIETDFQGEAQIIIDLDSTVGFQVGGKDVKISYTLKVGANCVPWDGYNGEGSKLPDATKFNLIVEYDAQTKNSELIAYSICPPIARDDKDSTSQNLPLVVKNSKLGINDDYIETDNNKIKYKLQNASPTLKGGSLNMAENGAYTYTPPKNFIGLDQFTYTICYTKYSTVCDSAVVNIKVLSGGFDPPDAQNDYYTVKQNEVLTKTITENDIGASLCKVDEQNFTTLQGGKITLSSSGVFTYTPASNFIGIDSIGYQICNGIVKHLCDSAWVFVKVILLKDIIVPSGFTPNNDGLNDFFEIENIAMYENEVKIVNRWGSLIYSATNYDNVNTKWTGNSNSSLLKGDNADGPYYYWIDLKDGNTPISGYVMVIK